MERKAPERAATGARPQDRTVAGGVRQPAGLRPGPDAYEPGVGKPAEQRHSLHQGRRKRVSIRAALHGNETLVVSVVDDGIGIDPSDNPHVFDRFSQLYSSTYNSNPRPATPILPMGTLHLPMNISQSQPRQWRGGSNSCGSFSASIHDISK